MIHQSASADAGLAGQSVPSSLELASLRDDYPGFRVWQEVTGDRVRYVARRLSPGIGPHTVVTADLDELRAVLDDAPAPPQAATGQLLDPGAPNIARMYDRWLGGKDNFEADRHAADAVAAEFPEIVQVARANRQFVVRAVAAVAAEGISQYLDIGAGLPTSPVIHQIAQHADPAARVAYVDNDPVVLATPARSWPPAPASPSSPATCASPPPS